jgi:ferredoxin
MPKIHIDEDLCVGTGDCVRNAPAAFALDDGADVVELLPQAEEQALEVLRKAAYDCPTGAITVDEA